MRHLYQQHICENRDVSTGNIPSGLSLLTWTANLVLNNRPIYDSNIYCDIDGTLNCVTGEGEMENNDGKCLS